MTLQEIIKTLDATALTGNPDLSSEINCAFAGDLMSDVLAYVKENALLLTGLINNQSIRTAELLDLQFIVFVRGKKPSGEVLAMAEDAGVCVLSTCFTLFEASGRLFAAGLRACKLGG